MLKAVSMQICLNIAWSYNTERSNIKVSKLMLNGVNDKTINYTNVLIHSLSASSLTAVFLSASPVCQTVPLPTCFVLMGISISSSISAQRRGVAFSHPCLCMGYVRYEMSFIFILLFPLPLPSMVFCTI